MGAGDSCFANRGKIHPRAKRDGSVQKALNTFWKDVDTGGHKEGQSAETQSYYRSVTTEAPNEREEFIVEVL